MKLQLKEDPREWQKFTAVLAGFLALGLLWAWRRRGLDPLLFRSGLALLALLLTAALCRPRWFRGLYRLAMTASFRVGMVVGRILLTVFFLLVLTPLGLALRLAGKDLLRLKRPSAVDTYWRPSRPPGPFDRLF